MEEVDGIYEDGEIFEVDDCTTCACNDGEVLCQTEQCKQPNCLNPITKAGECCPACPDEVRMRDQKRGGIFWHVGVFLIFMMSYHMHIAKWEKKQVSIACCEMKEPYHLCLIQQCISFIQIGNYYWIKKIVGGKEKMLAWCVMIYVAKTANYARWPMNGINYD